MNKYVKVMFGNTSSALESLKYKIDEINIADNWNPLATDPKEMGGFNFSVQDKILRWLVRGDTIYDVIIPDDAEVIDCPNLSAPHGVFRANKIILTNPRPVTDTLALDLYKKSRLPEKSYFKALAGCVTRGYLNTAQTIIDDKVNSSNIDLAISEYQDFYQPSKDNDLIAYNNYYLFLDKLKNLKANVEID